MRTYCKLVAPILAGMLLSCGCTVMSKERKITVSKIGEDDLHGNLSIEQESAQHLTYKLLLPGIGHLFFWFPPLSMGNEWEIRRQECAIYRRANDDPGVREDREVLIEVENSPFIAMNGKVMQNNQDLIYNYVMNVIDCARRRTIRDPALEALVPENKVKWCDWIAPLTRIDGDLERQSQKLLDVEHDVVFVERLIQSPYAVKTADLPGYSYTVASPVISTDLVQKTAVFSVQIARHFSDLKSGRKLGSVAETYHLSPGQMMGSALNQTLLE